jgi:hypothetical protein
VLASAVFDAAPVAHQGEALARNMRPDLAQQQPARFPVGVEQARAAHDRLCLLGKKRGVIDLDLGRTPATGSTTHMSFSTVRSGLDVSEQNQNV